MRTLEQETESWFVKALKLILFWVVIPVGCLLLGIYVIGPWRAISKINVQKQQVSNEQLVTPPAEVAQAPSDTASSDAVEVTIQEVTPGSGSGRSSRRHRYSSDSTDSTTSSTTRPRSRHRRKRPASTPTTTETNNTTIESPTPTVEPKVQPPESPDSTGNQ
jgi:hypothetical protein